jgi:hypothetical protein
MNDKDRREFFNRWNAENKNLPWTIVFTPADKKQENNFQEKHVPVESPTGRIIYTPHNCDLPDSLETPIGTIWECLGYRDGRLCLDQWIVVAKRGSRFWELFKRNI